MIDFRPVRNQEITYGQIAAGLTPDDLRRLTHEMIDTQLSLIADCTDEDVTCVPDDPEANDAFAIDPAEVRLPWTLGHVIVHTTASAEESAALAAELARGVRFHGRSRNEVPWQAVATIAQCRARLEESRRMRLASLDMWPGKPDLDNTYRYREDGEPINAINRFIRGLAHDDGHLEQIKKIVQQAQRKRMKEEG
ncbi:MAG TPA: DinB family protein [Anaerolineae bacterium]